MSDFYRYIYDPFKDFAESYIDIYGKQTPTLKELRSHELELLRNCLFDAPKDSWVLDAGCAVGLQTRWLGELSSQSTIVGIDRSEEMIEFASKLTPVNIEKGRIYYVKALLEALPIANDKCFAVSCLFGGLYHTPYYEDIIKEFFRILRPGGRCLVSVLNRWRFMRLIKALSRGRLCWVVDSVRNRESSLMNSRCEPIKNSYTIYFSESQLRLLFQKSGFTNIKIQGRFLLLMPKYESFEDSGTRLFWRWRTYLDRKISRSFISRKFADILFLQCTKQS
jgi:SAM-dependent methyltransferase